MAWHVGSLKTADRHDIDDAQAEIRGLREMSDEEYRQYVDDVTLARHHADRWMLRVLGHNYATYLETAAEVVQAIEDPSLRDREEIGDLAMALRIEMFNWLLSLRAYLDHTETWLKRTFGKDSDQVQAFERETARQFDTHFAYRFFYKLRNFVQHCGLPPLDGAINEGERGAARRSVSLHMKTGPLLVEFDGWGPVTADLQNLPETFDPDPLMAEMMQCIMDLSNSLTQAYKAPLEQAVARINALHASVPPSEGDPYLFLIPDEIEDDGGFERASLQMLPLIKVDLSW